MNSVLIMAKEGSLGLPGKNTWKVGNDTLLGRTIKDAHRNRLVDKIFVSTNGEGPASVGRALGAEIIRRDNELAKNEKFLEAVDQAVLTIKGKYPDLRLIAIPQCVVPFRDPDIFDRCFSFLLEHDGYDSIVTIRRTGFIPEALMRLEGEQLLPYFPDMQDKVSGSRQDSAGYEIDHAVECFTYQSWLNRDKGIKPWNYLGRKIKGIQQHYHNPNCFVDVHTFNDIRWLEFIVQHLGWEGMRREEDSREV